MRSSDWASYEAAFCAFKERARQDGTFAVKDVPLPPKGQVVEDAHDPQAWHRNLMKATLRWHPDRWSALQTLLADIEEQGKLKHLCEAMFRAVTRAKVRGFVRARQE